MEEGVSDILCKWKSNEMDRSLLTTGGLTILPVMCE